MCDYSLHHFSNRLAVEGEQLLVHRFPTGTLGLASPFDLWTPEEPSDQTTAGWWSRIKNWLILSDEKSVPAVCIPPGAQLVLRDIPQCLQRQLGVGEEEEVTFVQLGADAYSYRDAVRFNNGREVLLQKLAEGQRVDVLCLASVEAGPLQTLPAAVTRPLRGA
jgi:hypothetical protein